MAISKQLKFLIYISLAIVFLGILSLYFWYNPTNSEVFPKCPFYLATNIYCPGCGSQRAIHKILNMQIIGGLQHNWLLLLVILVLGYQMIVYLLKMTGRTIQKNILHRPVTTYAILIIVILFWILRNIDIYPFTILAP